LDRTGRDVDLILARANDLDNGSLLVLAAGPASSTELDAARGRARQTIHRLGLDAALERMEDAVAVWGFAEVPRTAGGWAWSAPGQDLAADLRRQAAPALLDAMMATMLGAALDEGDRELLLAPWREATDPLPG
jgi:hypothetical protein